MMDKELLLKSAIDFNSWKNEHKDWLGNFSYEAEEEDEPKSYPCVLITSEEYDECSYCVRRYLFVYLSDFNN